MAKHAKEFLSFTIAGKSANVAARSFYESLADMLEVLDEVDSQVSSVKSGSIEWQIVEAHTNSPLTISLEAQSKVAADYSAQIVDAFFGGLAELETSRRAPPYFTPRAIERLRDLNKHFENGVQKIVFANRDRRFSPSQPFIRNVAAIAKKPAASTEEHRTDYSETGAIEGNVDTLVGHTQNYFNLYDIVTKERVQCFFKDELKEQARQAWQKRVTVEGEIRYAADGHPKKMDAEKITLARDASELPQFKDFSIDITGGIESSAYVRGLRDD